MTCSCHTAWQSPEGSRDQASPVLIFPIALEAFGPFPLLPFQSAPPRFEAPTVPWSLYSLNSTPSLRLPSGLGPHQL